jgi:alpha(1,3/1,4) fucosyltransferase
MSIKIAFYAYKEKRLINDYLFKKVSKSNVYVQLAEELKDLKYIVHTLDIYKKKNSTPDICIFLDIPPASVKKIIGNSETKLIVLLREADMISKVNYDTERHKEFDCILTWKYKLVDNIKYFYFPSTKFDLRKRINIDNYFNRKLCTLINSNLSSKSPGELYSARLEIIKRFEKEHIDSFDLWGVGWNKWKFKIGNKTIFKSKLFTPNRISYQGVAPDKLKIMSKYKFSICFENTCLIEDYISEKIFDSFLAGTIPIYYGAKNIKELVPVECFIDYRDFKNFKDLFNFISNMDEKRYLDYIDNIDSFLKSDKARVLSLRNWKKTIINSVNNVLNKR